VLLRIENNGTTMKPQQLGSIVTTTTVTATTVATTAKTYDENNEVFTRWSM